MASTPDARPPGRPRSAGTDQAIHRAALELVAEVGYRDATLEAIAARAGVGTATIHRRYATKRDLLVAVLTVEADAFTAPRTGDVVEDLAELLRALWAGVHAGRLGRLLAAMAFTDPELFELGWSSLARPRRDRLRDVVEAAVAAGQLRADLDVDAFVDVLSAVPIWTQLIRPDVELTLDAARATARLLVHGAGAPHSPEKGNP